MATARYRYSMKGAPMPIALLNALSKEHIFDLLAYLESGGGLPLHEHGTALPPK